MCLVTLTLTGLRGEPDRRHPVVDDVRVVLRPDVERESTRHQRILARLGPRRLLHGLDQLCQKLVVAGHTGHNSIKLSFSL